MISEEQEFQTCHVKKKSDRKCPRFHFFSVSTLSYSATTWKIHENGLIENNEYLIGNKYYSFGEPLNLAREKSSCATIPSTAAFLWSTVTVVLRDVDDCVDFF